MYELGFGMVGGQVKKRTQVHAHFNKQSLVALAHDNHPAQLLQPPPPDENHGIAVPDTMETSWVGVFLGPGFQEMVIG